jgi:hypothetical protein
MHGMSMLAVGEKLPLDTTFQVLKEGKPTVRDAE